MTFFRRLALAGALAALALPGFSASKHRAFAPPTAATITLTGVIRDAVTGLPISGADAFADGQKSALTGADGRYSLRIALGRNVMVTAEHFAYGSQAKTILGASNAVADFSLTPHATVSVRLVSGETHSLDYPSTQFAYLIDFGGYIHGDNANWCKADGTSITPDKSEVRRILGPATLADQSKCCPNAQVLSVNVEMKNGDKFPVYFNDSCVGYDVVFYGSEPSSGIWQYMRFVDIAEIDFP